MTWSPITINDNSNNNRLKPSLKATSVKRQVKQIKLSLYFNFLQLTVWVSEIDLSYSLSCVGLNIRSVTVLFCSIICLRAWHVRFYLLNTHIYAAFHAFQFEKEPGNNERFAHLEYGKYSMFESHCYEDKYLGCSQRDGSLILIDVKNWLRPDPRALFLMHAIGSN